MVERTAGRCRWNVRQAERKGKMGYKASLEVAVDSAARTPC